MDLFQEMESIVQEGTSSFEASDSSSDMKEGPVNTDKDQYLDLVDQLLIEGILSSNESSDSEQDNDDKIDLIEIKQLCIKLKYLEVT